MGWIKDRLEDIGDVVLGGLVDVAIGTLGIVTEGIFALEAITVKIEGILNPQKLKEEAMKQGMKDALVKNADACTHSVTLQELNSNKQLVVEGDSISDEIKCGMVIY